MPQMQLLVQFQLQFSVDLAKSFHELATLFACAAIAPWRIF
jgi:hypothetical protein